MCDVMTALAAGGALTGLAGTVHRQVTENSTLKSQAKNLKQQASLEQQRALYEEQQRKNLTVQKLSQDKVSSNYRGLTLTGTALDTLSDQARYLALDNAYQNYGNKIMTNNLLNQSRLKYIQAERQRQYGSLMTAGKFLSGFDF
ncbi:MAG: hypothetical protein K1X44_07460 [Alphaproteobacteria bacterium]|nr:hypothetical protein [Alphaproteobacteria bacterium]